MLVQNVQNGNIPLAGVTADFHYPVAATAAVVTKTAPSDTSTRWVVHSIHGSYSAAPTGGRLTVQSSSTVIFDIDITAAGPFSLSGLLIPCVAGESCVITLASGAGAVVGKLNASVVKQAA